ncbi:MAG: DNA adenine methylase [Myxococcales bacterium]|nr:DNA adenine methylase [Myxococcales bacterium]
MAPRARALPATAQLLSTPVGRFGTKAARRAPAAAPAAAPATEPVATPIVKWVGGKTRLLSELLARMPARFERYYEPFAGGAALFFRMAPQRAVLGDDNADLVNLYRTVGLKVDDVIRRLAVHRRLHNEGHYYEMRARWNDANVSWTHVDRAAAFVYLNKTCFNGLWRVNRAGHFNVPMGRYEDPPICAVDSLRAAATVLQRAELRHGHYREAVADARAGDFLYFDPPYDPVTVTANFTGYTAGAFGSDDQRELAELARHLVARGCKVMLSNSDTPFVRSLYKGFRVDRVRCGRAINSNAAKRGDVDEVIIMGER